jgi:hypothetical protein
MIPLLLNKSFLKKTTFLFFMSLTLNAQIEKWNLLLVCRYAKSRIANILFYGKDIAQNKVSSNGIKLRTLQNRKSNYFLSPLIQKSDCI